MGELLGTKELFSEENLFTLFDYYVYVYEFSSEKQRVDVVKPSAANQAG